MAVRDGANEIWGGRAKVAIVRRKVKLKGKTWAGTGACGYSWRMQVRVLYFGVLQDLFGTANEPVELPLGATVGELLRVLRARTSNQAMGDKDQERLWRSLAVAVNQEYGSPGVVLREADEVALLPPVSGGCCALLRGGRKACFASKYQSGNGARDAREEIRLRDERERRPC